MYFYIDPGTGSMLFTILIGIIGAAIYAFRNLLVKAKFWMSGGKQKQTGEGRNLFVIFTDSKRYWSIFKPLCDEMEKRGEDVLYLTASPDDPLLKEPYEHIKAEFIGEGNKAFARMNFLKADIVLSSTPGLDVYQWKRSRDVKWYAHIFHAANDVTSYRMFGLDYYDAVLLSGQFQIDQTRKLEKMRSLPEKELVQVGIPQMDDLKRKLDSAPKKEKADRPTVLLAPSWGANSIFNKYGEKIFEALKKTGYHIIVRPHPQSLTSEKELIDTLKNKYPDSEDLEWNYDNDNFDVLNRSSLLISDFSGVVFDFALVFDKPVICADVSFDKGVYDAWWLEEEMWTFEVLPKLSLQLTEKDLGNMKELIDRALNAPELKAGRDLAREQTWTNQGRSVEAMADYLVKTKERLAAEEAEAQAKAQPKPAQARA
jgi:hypothetical protein